MGLFFKVWIGRSNVLSDISAYTHRYPGLPMAFVVDTRWRAIDVKVSMSWSVSLWWKFCCLKLVSMAQDFRNTSCPWPKHNISVFLLYSSKIINYLWKWWKLNFMYENDLFCIVFIIVIWYIDGIAF